MTEGGSVDFDLIRADYDFFLNHSTETPAQAAALLPHLTPAPRAMLDFGCGTGNFTERLLAAAPAPAMRLSLVEPVDAHRAEAARRLRPLVAEVSDSPEIPDVKYDLILANHSLYYVQNISLALTELVARLAPRGRLIIALLDRGNALARLWRAGFGLTGKPFPFALAEDAEPALTALGMTFRRERIDYEVRFPDAAENRLKVLRFLFGPERQILSPDGLRLFDPHRRDGQIVIQTTYPHIVTD